MNWRDLMADPPESLASPQNPQNPQNTQNWEAGGIIAHSADIAERVAAVRRARVSIPLALAVEGLPLPVPPPIPPLCPGWLVAYRDQQWVLCGGCDDRAHGTVQECQRSAGAWTVTLTDGQRLPIASIRSVAKTNDEGELVAAWTVCEHGYDGMKGEPSPVVAAAIPARMTCAEAVPAMLAA